MAYQLHPDIALRNDIDRNLLYVRNPMDSLMPDIVRSISTPASLLLALFDGQRPLAEVVRLWSQLFCGGPPDQEVYRHVKSILLTDLNPELKIKDILIKSEPAAGQAPVEVVPDICQLIVKKELVNLEEPRLRIPLRLLFIPTLHCTQRCYYCYSTDTYPGAGKPLSFARLREIFQEAKNLGIEVIDLSGGEPLAYPHIFKLLELFGDLGLTPNIPTKYPLTPAEVHRLQAAGLKSLQFSIDAIDPDLLEMTTGVPDYGRRVIGTFHVLQEAGIRLRINSVITPKNMHDIISLIHFLTGFDNIYRLAFSPYAKSRFHHDDAYYLNPAKYADLVKQAEEILSDFPNMRFFPGDIPADSANDEPAQREEAWSQRAFCTGGRHAFVVLPDGQVTMCEELYYHPAYLMGDLSRQSIMEMWNSKEALRVSQPDRGAVPEGPCRDCRDFKACHISPGRCVREAIKLYGQQRHYYPDPRCPQAPPAF